VGHDRVAGRCYGDLEHHVVAGVPEEWTPQIEDRLVVCSRAEIVDERLHVLGLEVARQMPQEGRLVLQHQRNGDRDLELTVSKPLDDRE